MKMAELMKHADPVTVGKSLARVVGEYLEGLPPAVAVAAFTGMTGAIAGSIPEDRWEAMLRAAETPCEHVGCLCHDFRTKFLQLLEPEREDFRAQKGRRG